MYISSQTHQEIQRTGPEDRTRKKAQNLTTATASCAMNGTAGPTAVDLGKFDKEI